jgi:hypothetical protein
MSIAPKSCIGWKPDYAKGHRRAGAKPVGSIKFLKCEVSVSKRYREIIRGDWKAEAFERRGVRTLEPFACSGQAVGTFER